MKVLLQSGFFAVGADLSETALAQCDAYLRAQFPADRYFLLPPTSLEHLTLSEAAMDAAICIDVLGHLINPVPVLRELARVIRPGGYLYTSIFHPDDECRTGPRMRTGSNAGEGWYLPSAPDAARTEYYFRFYSEQEAVQLLSLPEFRLKYLARHSWPEPPHSGYRDEPHTHVSWFALLNRT
jgi:SAM-dependent methyltransferase